MKKKYLMFILIGFVLLSFAFVANKLLSVDKSKMMTDSGFDGGYDGGSDSSYSSSDDDSHVSSARKLTGADIGLFIVSGFVIIIIIIIPIIMTYQEKKKNEEKLQLVRLLIARYGLDEVKIIEDAYDIYVRVQIAWMNDTLDDVKDVLSDEMYNQYDAQLSTLRAKNQQNIMEDFKYVGGYVNDIERENDYYILTVLLEVECKDYIIDKNSFEVLRGNKKKTIDYKYFLVFKYSYNESRYCPNCGAKLEKGGGVVCKSCGSKIIVNENKMLLIRKGINYYFK